MLKLPLIARRYLRLLGALMSTMAMSAQALAQATPAPPAAVLPEAVRAALAHAQVPLDAISVLVSAADGQGTPLLAHRTNAPMNPASVMKLVTTSAALDLLGPTYTWATPVWLDGTLSNGVLRGNLVIQGQGDPKLVLERLWLLLHRVQGLGIGQIEGDIVLDRHAFATPAENPSAFDGEPLRPYNASPDALLINYKALVLTFTPSPATGMALVQLDPPLAGVKLPASVPLASGKAASCGDWRSALKADWSDPQRIRLTGRYPADCGEKIWPVAYADPASYNARAVAGLWHHMGGKLRGQVRDGLAPASAPSFVMNSPPLAEVIRDINKFSNNVMAQQLFMTLGLPTPANSAGNGNDTGSAPAASNAVVNAVATPQTARAALNQWWQRRISATDLPTIDNGSGLSRDSRISAQQLGQLLQVAYASPFSPELMASLPIVGLDGTLRRSQASVASAHLKTGSLQGVLARAGYVHTPSGRPLSLVVIVNHPNASAARPALDALVDWAAAQTVVP